MGRLLEFAVFNNLGLGNEIACVVNIGKIAGEDFALYGEGAGVENLDFTDSSLALTSSIFS